MWQKRKFDRYVASQPIVAHRVYGNAFSIQLNLADIQKNNFSTILGGYVNEKKAVIDDTDHVAYIIPEYNSYQIKPQNYRKQKLLQYVAENNFVTMLNQSEIVTEEIVVNNHQNKKIQQYYFKVVQNEVRKYQCMLIASLLIESGLAKIKNNDLYIIYNFQQKLEKTSKIQSDLSRFRTLLGESNNLAALLSLVETGKIRQDKLFISISEAENNELNIEMMSLVDIGIAKYVNISNDETNTEESGFELDASFASWLLEYISNTSDRISFGDMYL